MSYFLEKEMIIYSNKLFYYILIFIILTFIKKHTHIEIIFQLYLVSISFISD